MDSLTLEDIQQARIRIGKQLRQTQLIELVLPGRSGKAAVKPEHLQPTGSFKIRGALNCIALLTDDQKRCGVIAYSTGNHAQSVALAARSAGTSATIVMSADVPVSKLEQTRAFGARILMAEPTSEARRRLAEDVAGAEGQSLIPPYDDFMVMAGQGTIGLEILEQVVPSEVFVPVGGGGLIAGIAVAIKQTNPSVRIVGVEPTVEDDTFRSWAAGERVSIAGPSQSIADAIKVQIPGEKTFPLLQRYVDDIVLVDDGQIINAMRLYVHQTGYRLEPSGAVALAAIMQSDDRRGSAICIGTGQNVTEQRFNKLLE